MSQANSLAHGFARPPVKTTSGTTAAREPSLAAPATGALHLSIPNPAARRNGADGANATSPVDPATWANILGRVRQQHPTLNRTWFDDLSARYVGNMTIQVLVQTAAQLNFCQQQMTEPFKAAAMDVTGRLMVVHFHCEHLPKSGGVFNEADQLLPLSPDYVFDQFVTGPCNRLAHAASVAVSEQPGKAYNPLFIHGGVGLGKTHLLQAISQKVLERNPEARILYLSCDSFVNQFINSVSNSTMNDFRNRYRNVDMLVIDDIHFLRGHQRTQEEFFHTFNTLHQQHKQIVLSADCSPAEIPELEERLVSRFNWGLVARIDKPCYETRVAILRKKSRMRGLELPDDVICYAAARIENNTRELEGAITKFQGLAMLSGGTINLDVAKQALGEAVEQREKHVSMQDIFDVVTNYFSIKVSDLQGKKRNQSIAFPRQICMFLARRHTRFSLEEIGGYFGGRDHTTVLHGVRTIDKQMKIDRDVAQQVNHLDGQLVG